MSNNYGEISMAVCKILTSFDRLKITSCTEDEDRYMCEYTLINYWDDIRKNDDR